MRKLASILALLSAGCIGVEEVPVSLSGIVSQGSEPVAGAVLEIFRPEVNGLPQLAGETTSGVDGSYSLSTSTPGVKCILVYVTVEIRDTGGTVLFEDRANAQECGDNLVDFTF